MVRLLNQYTVVLITLRSCVRNSYRPDFYFLFGLVSLFKYFAYIYCIKMIICSTLGSNSPLAKLESVNANNGKVVRSRIMRTRFYFLFGLVSLSK